MVERNVSVIIPSYNRAHVLWEIIPSYFQEEVLEVIVINDCSTDNTEKVLLEIKENYPNLVILVNDKNLKQMYSKNKGIEVAKGKYIFFGDDDSFLMPGAVKQLLKTKLLTKADVIGARILYMNKDESTFEQCIHRHRKHGLFRSDLSKLEFNFTADLGEPVECFYAQSLILVERSKLGNHRFNLSYFGNCYREETDFMLSLYIKGFKFVYDSQALLINLPPQKATGGARTSNKFRYHCESIINNYIFLIRYNSEINNITNDNHTIIYRQFLFIYSKIIALWRKFIK